MTSSSNSHPQIHLTSNKCVSMIGITENVRFLTLALTYSQRKKHTLDIAVTNPNIKENVDDPTLMWVFTWTLNTQKWVSIQNTPKNTVTHLSHSCTAYKKNRFYMFTNREPDQTNLESGRYVWHTILNFLSPKKNKMFTQSSKTLGPRPLFFNLRDILNERPSREDIVAAQTDERSKLASR